VQTNDCVIRDVDYNYTATWMNCAGFVFTYRTVCVSKKTSLALVFVTARGELRRVLFLALWLFSFRYEIYRKPQNLFFAKFSAEKTCLVICSKEFECQDQRPKVKQRSRSSGQKRGFQRISRKPLNGFAPNTQGRRLDKFEGQGQFLRPACGLCLEKHLLCSGFVFSECFVYFLL